MTIRTVPTLVAALALAVLLHARSGAGAPRAPRLVDGVASGDVGPGSAVVWARAEPAAPVQVELLLGTSIVRRANVQSAEKRDGTAQVRFTKLEPGRPLHLPHLARLGAQPGMAHERRPS
jgi:phosphodiesterase/alkaline phosphatase D-like protein